VPTPADAKKSPTPNWCSSTLGLEGWLRGCAVSGQQGRDHHRDFRHRAVKNLARTPIPHAWQSPLNAKVYVANIRDALVGVDPADARHSSPMPTPTWQNSNALDGEVRQAWRKFRKPPQG